MPGPRNIALGQAKRQGAIAVTYCCQHIAVHCHRSGEMRLDDAIASWGGTLRLDQIPARGIRCGSIDHADVRTRDPKREGSGPAGKTIEQ